MQSTSGTFSWTSGPLSQTYTADYQCLAETTPGGLRTDYLCKSTSSGQSYLTTGVLLQNNGIYSLTCETRGDNNTNPTWYGDEPKRINRGFLKYLQNMEFK